MPGPGMTPNGKIAAPGRGRRSLSVTGRLGVEPEGTVPVPGPKITGQVLAGRLPVEGA